jgi:hypothetical protein
MISNQKFKMKKIQMVDLKGQYEKIKETVNASIQTVLYQRARSSYISKKFRNLFRCKTRNSLRKRNRCFANSNDGIGFETRR